ncbi:MAG: thioredoxin family protein [Bacteroidales bacterium]|nr:thioredoxin family protein [Bacteroidales bacterium]
MTIETSEKTIDYSDQTTWLLGYFNPLQLKTFPHENWYLKGFDAYQPDPEVIERLKNIVDSEVTITIVMGTWCPDSRREVPRFMKILDFLEFPAERLTFIGVDDAKISPVEEYFNLNIQRVPTFIFYKNKIESGRIIENPVTSLEQDMENILKGIEN